MTKQLFVYFPSPVKHELNEGRDFVFFLNSQSLINKCFLNLHMICTSVTIIESPVRAWARMLGTLGIQNRGSYGFEWSDSFLEDSIIRWDLRCQDWEWEVGSGLRQWLRTGGALVVPRGRWLGQCGWSRGFLFEMLVSHTKKVGWGQCAKGQMKMFEMETFNSGNHRSHLSWAVRDKKRAQKSWTQQCCKHARWDSLEHQVLEARSLHPKGQQQSMS